MDHEVAQAMRVLKRCDIEIEAIKQLKRLIDILARENNSEWQLRTARAPRTNHLEYDPYMGQRCMFCKKYNPAPTGKKDHYKDCSYFQAKELLKEIGETNE